MYYKDHDFCEKAIALNKDAAASGNGLSPSPYELLRVLTLGSGLSQGVSFGDNKSKAGRAN
jgi:hypothetical protein